MIKYVASSNLSIYYTWKNIKQNNKFKITGRTWNAKFNYLMDQILCLIFNIILSVSLIAGNNDW